MFLKILKIAIFKKGQIVIANYNDILIIMIIIKRKHQLNKFQYRFPLQIKINFKSVATFHSNYTIKLQLDDYIGIRKQKNIF